MKIQVKNPNWESEFRSLGPGWDSYSARVITEAAIQQAKEILDQAPYVIPLSNGGIQIEWHNCDAMIKISPTGEVLY